MTNRTMSAREWATLIGLSILWGGSFFFVAVALRALPPVTIVAARVGLAAVALWLVVRLTGTPVPRGWKVWSALLGMGMLNNVIPFNLIVWGQSHVASGVASILNATTPLFGVLVAHFLTVDEKLTVPRLAGVLIGLAGVATMVGGAALETSGIAVLAQLAILGAALSYAFSGVFGRRFKAMAISPLATAAGQITASSLVLIPLALLIDRPWTLPVPGLEVVGAVLGLALVSTALAYIIFFRLLATAGATNLLLVTLLIPVSAVLLGVAFLGERPEPRQILGMGLIALGLGVIDGRPFRWLVARGGTGSSGA